MTQHPIPQIARWGETLIDIGILTHRNL